MPRTLATVLAELRRRLVSIGAFPIEYLFLVIAIPFATWTVVETPPMQSPDEAAHLYRAWGLSTGQIACKTGSLVDLPEGLRIFADTFSSERIDDGVYHLPMLWAFDTADSLGGPTAQAYTQFCSYNPLSHLPPAIGIAIVRLFHPTAVGIAYGAVVSNALFGIIAAFLAIRWSPFGKTYFFAAAVLSGTMAQFASVSGDTANIGGLLLITALFLRASHEKRLATKDLTLLSIASLAFIHVKPSYTGFILLGFLLHTEQFPSRRARNIFLAVFLASNILLATLLVIGADTGSYLRPEGVDPPRQVDFIREHPITALSVVVRETFDNTPRWFGAAKSGSLPYLAAFFLGFLILGHDGIRPSPRHRIILSLIVVGTALLIELLEFLFWNEPGTTKIAGIQSRYFYGLLPLPYLAAHMPLRRFPMPLPNLLRIAALAVLAGFAVTGALKDIRHEYAKRQFSDPIPGTPHRIALETCGFETDDLSFGPGGFVETAKAGNHVDIDATRLLGLSFASTGTGNIRIWYRFRGDEKFSRERSDVLKSVKDVSLNIETLTEREHRPLERIRITFSDRPETFTVDGFTLFCAPETPLSNCPCQE